MTDQWKKLLWDASKVAAPTFPRQASDDGTIQAPRKSRAEFVAGLVKACENGMPGYYSVYSFPRGHSQDGCVPHVDCIFIDLDVTGENYDPNSGKTDFADWRRDMSALLARARMIARAILEAGAEANFRVVLSGHKGLHIYLDFPAIHPLNGTFDQFKRGLKGYGNDVMQWLDDAAGGVNIDPWVDVDGSDLGRLGRHPNTRHHGAAYDDTDRWCVPVTVEELADITVDDYLDLTTGPREITPAMHRTPSERAGNEAIQWIRTASAASSSRGTSSYNPEAVQAYKDRVNHDIELEDLLDPLLMNDRPCIIAFRNRADAYDHGNQSRIMELSIMGRFIQMGVPREVMHEFFEAIPGYSEQYTDDLINDLIGRGQQGYKAFNCETIAGGYDDDGKPLYGSAAEFCLGAGECGVYDKNPDIHIHDQRRNRTRIPR